MIVAIERTKFTYLYKYPQIRVDINQVLDRSIKDLQHMMETDFAALVSSFNKILPLYEQDHEVILLEIDKNKIRLQDGVILVFDAVLSIYPLTTRSRDLLEGKINADFIVNFPIFERAIEANRINRTIGIRAYTSSRLLSCYSLENTLSKVHMALIESSVKTNILITETSKMLNFFLDWLILYKKSPSYIPEGNVENILKIGAIAIMYLGKPDEVFTNGPFYNSCVMYKTEINTKSYYESYLAFLSIPDGTLKASHEKMVEYIAKDYSGVDIFKVSYFFLAFRTYLNKNDNNIVGLDEEIKKLIAYDRYSGAFVLALIGYVFSFELIYEGLHRLLKAPLLRSSREDREEKVPKPIKSEEKTEVTEKPALTVGDFRHWLADHAAKAKLPLWHHVLDANYANKFDPIRYEDLLNKLNANPEVKDQLLKPSKDKPSIKTFFDLHK